MLSFLALLLYWQYGDGISWDTQVFSFKQQKTNKTKKMLSSIQTDLEAS